MNGYAAFEVKILAGTIRCSFDDWSKLNVSAPGLLLYEGRLYQLDGTFGQHDGSWFPVSGTTITGHGGSKVRPTKTEPIIDDIVLAVSDHLAAHPELIALAKQQQFDAKTKRIEDDLKREESYVARYQKDVDKAKEQLAEHLASAPA